MKFRKLAVVALLSGLGISSSAFSAAAVPCEIIHQFEPSIPAALRAYVKNGLNPNSEALLAMACKYVQDAPGSACAVTPQSQILCDFYSELKK